MRILPILLFILISHPAAAQSWRTGNYHHPWADSVLKTLTLRQQIGQMMMVAAWSNKGPEHTEEIENLIRNHQVGGLCFFQGQALKQAYLTNYYQDLSRIPMLVSMDAEWGLAMRLRDMQKFPYQMTLGAAHNDSLIYRCGLGIGLECRRLGVHINFAPDVDVNTNPENPIIGFRSFGEESTDVARQGEWMMRGLQDAGIIACAKHFPGHGDSEADSHIELPLLGHSKDRLDSLELYPFRRLFSAGVKSAMVGHLEIPSLDTTPHRPSSLSPAVVNTLLKQQMGFRGLVITDALNMKGVSRTYGGGYAEAAAVLAGNDIILFPENVPKAIELIENLVKEGQLDSAELSDRVRKILYFKAMQGLDHYQPVETGSLMADLDLSASKKLEAEAAAQAVTVVTDRNEILPLLQHTRRSMAWWGIGKAGNYPFGVYLQKYHKMDAFFTYRDSGYETFGTMADSLARNYETVIVSLHDQNLWGKKSTWLPQPVVQNLYTLAERTRVVVVMFGHLYILKNLPNLTCALVAYEDEPAYQKATADILFGEKPSLGHLPATAGKGYLAGAGVHTEDRLVHHIPVSSPVTAGFKYDFSTDMDSLLSSAQRMHATPGGQVMVLHKGEIIYNRAHGSFFYDSVRPVSKNSMFDLASITKVAATTLCVMRLQEKGMLRLDAHIHDYLPEVQGTNKSKLTIRELLTHEAGLPAYIPFYKQATKEPGFLNRQKDSIHTVQLSDSVWMTAAWQDSVWQQILRCEVKKKQGFLYSDLGFIILGKIVQRVSGKTVAEYVSKFFYQPMGLTRTSFQPAQTYYPAEMPPTVEDNYFRNGRVQGYVHDPTAAMLGGVAGHAGLFSNAEDLAKLMQMLLNGGMWEGNRYLKTSTIKDFTSAAHKNTHRGLGFDKPNGAKDPAKNNVSPLVPVEAFGHSGFTGNWAWADPKNQIVFVFLSNRTYPDENNRKLITENIRSKAIEIVYKAR
ncbi:MAG: serine hydrolase [Bacteroidetes bacterium]|nr:serine hydrolase [Bacteroidota bacterium]